MLKYFKKEHRVKAFCPNCRSQIEFHIPDYVFQQKKLENARYPFPFLHIHGHPPHSITIYLDEHDDIRGHEYGDAIQLSNDIIERMFQERNLKEENTAGLVLKSIFNTYTTALEARIPQVEYLNFEIGEKLGAQFEPLFNSDSYHDLFTELQQFWLRNGFGRIEDLKIEDEFINFKVYECFECSHLPNLGHPVCKLDEGFLTALLKKKFEKEYLVQELECVATGKNFCEFEIKEIQIPFNPKKIT